MTGWQDSFQPAAGPAAMGGWQSSFQPSEPDAQPESGGAMAALAAPMDAASRGGAQLISNIMAPFSSEQTMGKLRTAGLYDVQHPEIANPFIRGVAESPLGSFQQAEQGAMFAPLAPVMNAAQQGLKNIGVPQGALDAANMAGTIMSLAGPPDPTKKTSIRLPNGASNSSRNIFLNNQGAPVKSQALSASNIRDMAGSAYDTAANQGGALHPNAVDAFINKASSVLPQTPAGKIVMGETSASKLVDRLQKLKGQPLSLAEAQEIDSGIGELANSEVIPATGKLTAEGQKLYQVQQSLRDTIENAGPNNLIGGKAGFDSWKQGRDLWSASQRANDIERIMNRAEMTDNPVTALRTGFRTLASNPARLRGYTKTEVAAIQNAARTGIVTDALRTAGSRLISTLTGAAGGSIGGPLGSMAGAGAGYALSTPLRAAADSLQRAKGTKVIKAIGNRPAVRAFP